MHQGRLVLHIADGREHSYVVEDGGTVFRYRIGAPEPVAAVPWPPARDLRLRNDEAR